MSRSIPDKEASRQAGRPPTTPRGNTTTSSATLVDFLGHVDVLAGVPTELREETVEGASFFAGVPTADSSSGLRAGGGGARADP
jgi:hypothetical protein